MQTKKKASTKTKEKKKKSADELDIEGIISIALWTSRFVAIAEALKSANLPHTDIKWVSTIASFAFPDTAPSGGSCAVGFATDCDDDVYEDDVYARQ